MPSGGIGAISGKYTARWALCGRARGGRTLFRSRQLNLPRVLGAWRHPPEAVPLLRRQLTDPGPFGINSFRTLIFWLFAEKESLHPRLDRRVDKMIEVSLRAGNRPFSRTRG